MHPVASDGKAALRAKAFLCQGSYRLVERVVIWLNNLTLAQSSALGGRGRLKLLKRLQQSII